MHLRELDDRQLRSFGASLAALLLALAGLAAWRWHWYTASTVLAGVAALLATVYYARPATRRPIYRVFRRITYPIALIMTILVLAFVYIAVLTPIGLLLRLRGHRLRESAPDSQTFWVDCGEPAETSQYFHTY